MTEPDSKPASKPKSTQTISNQKTKEMVNQKKCGAPSKYKESVHPLMARALAKMGLIDIEIAREMEISEPTFISWKKEHPEFLAALSEGKAIPDLEVEKSLYKRALGYETEEVELRPKPRAKGAGRPPNEKMEVVRIYRKSYAPDVIAQIFWLKNRRPDRWRDKQDIEHSGNVGYKVIPDDLSEEIKE